MPKVLSLIILFIFTFSNCAHQKVLDPNLKKTDKAIQKITGSSTLFNDHFTGFKLIDLETDQVVFEKNADKLFTPASNMKLYTFLISKMILGDSAFIYQYNESDNGIILKTLGVPDLQTGAIDSLIDFISNLDKKTSLYTHHVNKDYYGSGWAWDDYNYTYQSAKSFLPIHNNHMKVVKSGNASVSTTPLFFRNHFIWSTGESEKIIRENNKNYFTVNPEKLKPGDTLNIPFIPTEETISAYLTHVSGIQTEVHNKGQISHFLNGSSTLIDTLYYELLNRSDNFIAEQLMLMSSMSVLDKMSTKSIIKYSLDSLLTDLPQKIRWVDGSGLSRYNLVSPNTTCYILKEILKYESWENLKKYLPKGTNEDTLDPIFSNEEDWIWAKTGTLSNNFSLSGYLRTDSGKYLAFSMMNNHYIVPKKEIVKEIHQILNRIKATY